MGFIGFRGDYMGVGLGSLLFWLGFFSAYGDIWVWRSVYNAGVYGDM